VFKELLEVYRKPIVIDADGLNILALHSEWESLIPPHSILTPHPKEFERLAGIWSTEEECAGKLINFSRILDCILILKGHETKIACPDGKLFVNTTGNPGMAKGGSGDALTGIITAFLAQGYTSEEASLLGVYLHGLAGDIAAERTSEFSMLPSDLIDSLSEAFRRLL
ncbi:MAG: NAD(P)H-hydrate dehydratase, partial [Flavobacteriales bacterium]